MAASGTDLMLRSEVAALFRVTPRTITRWATEGKLHPIVTPGGGHRYLTGEVRALFAGKSLSTQQLDALREGIRL